MKRWPVFLIVVAAVALGLGACSVAMSATPTATAVPPTHTPLPPTITPTITPTPDPHVAGADCGGCHTAEHQRWSNTLHAASPADVLLNQEHNEAELLTDECVTCHAPFQAGTFHVGDFVQPLDQKGLGSWLMPTYCNGKPLNARFATTQPAPRLKCWPSSIRPRNLM